MSATYNLKLIKTGFASIDCVGKVRHNKQYLFGNPIGMYVKLAETACSPSFDYPQRSV